MERNFSYESYLGNLRTYAAEREASHAAVVAARLDELLRDGTGWTEVESLIIGETDNLAAVFARMLRFPRLFYCDALEHFQEATIRHIGMYMSHAPTCCRPIFKNRECMPSRELALLIEDVCSSREAMWKSAGFFLKKNGWLLGRLLQEDVYLRCSSGAKGMLREFADSTSPVLRRAFVTQIMTSDRVDIVEKIRVYVALKPYREVIKFTNSDNIIVGASLLGEQAAVTGTHVGLTRPYSHNHIRPDYHLAVCEQMQRVYAESTYIRYQYARNRFQGYERIRSSLCRLGGLLSTSSVREDFKNAAANDDPGSFRLACDMEGIVMNANRLVWLISKEKVNILEFLVRECTDEVDDIISLGDLALHLSANADWSVALRISFAIESVRPGTISSVVDPFGNDVLWYTLYNYRCGPKECRSEFISFLERSGCDRSRTNHLGISFADIIDAN